MPTKVYDLMIILDPNRYVQDQAGVSSQVPDLILKLGGEILVSRLWNEQRLAYPIDGHRKGVYWLVLFRLDTQKVAELNEAMRISETILRSLLIDVDPRLVEQIAAHYRGGGQRPRAAEPVAAGAVTGEDVEMDGEM